jgi:hypothetical protein
LGTKGNERSGEKRKIRKGEGGEVVAKAKAKAKAAQRQR